MSWLLGVPDDCSLPKNQRELTNPIDSKAQTMDPIIGQIQIFGTLARPSGRTADGTTAPVRKDSGEAHLDYLQITMQN